MLLRAMHHFRCAQSILMIHRCFAYTCLHLELCGLLGCLITNSISNHDSKNNNGNGCNQENSSNRKNNTSSYKSSIIALVKGRWFLSSCWVLQTACVFMCFSRAAHAWIRLGIFYEAKVWLRRIWLEGQGLCSRVKG